MCCLPDQDQKAGVNPKEIAGVDLSTYVDLYQVSTQKYQPQHFDRHDGWQGKTYEEAVQFCSDQDNGRKVCPYDAVCPLGPNSEPLGASKNGPYDGEEGTGAWVPISDVDNNWVQVGGDAADTCITWLAKNPHTPGWGVTGEGSEELTRHLFCCDNLLPEESGEETSSQQVVSNSGWVDRSTGWNGKTYLQALSFCATSQKMIICPYNVICPQGESGLPYGKTKPADDGAGMDLWAPVSDTLNDWVNIGSNNMCARYGTTHSEPPDWGLSGITQQDITPQIICCDLSQDGSLTAVDSADTSSTTSDKIDPFGYVGYMVSNHSRSHSAFITESQHLKLKNLLLCAVSTNVVR